ncbi:hypothetical protein H8E65_07855 [Candidatus Bathyarchaeota archaeon]|nr:hypothetical protein [Candidatus Bathyarchaeota archaeon]MBL7078906.1 hypothetical protein [Candidatus Bathyarchaeota archaeon]
MVSILVAPASAQEGDQALIVGSISSGGLPVEELEIIINMAMGETYIPIFNATTDSEGRFEVFDDLFGNSFLLEFQYGGISHLEAFVSVNDTYTVDFDLSGGLEFVVLGLDGRGVEGVHVNLVNKIGYAVGHAETDSSGSGKFEGLNMGDPFVLVFDYEGVPYSEIIEFVNSTTASVELHLLETTTSDERIEANMHHVVVEMEGDYLSVWEGITFRNLGDQIFNNSWLKIWLPPAAEEIDSDVMDCCVQTTEEGILIDPMDPIFPAGTFETKVEYKIKAKSSKQVLAARMEYDTPSFLFLIAKMPGVTLESPVGLTFDSERNLGGTDYLIYRGIDLTAGETVSVQFNGLVSWTDVLLRNPLIWAGGLLVAPIALLVYFFVLKKDGGSEEPKQQSVAPLSEALETPRSEREEPPSAGERSIEDLEVERNALRSVLKKIEEDHRKGEISDEAYRSLKSKYRDNLKEIEAELQSPPVDDEREGLMAEELAIGSVLEKIASDHEEGLLSEGAYNRLRERYEERLAEVRAKLGKNS